MLPLPRAAALAGLLLTLLAAPALAQTSDRAFETTTLNVQADGETSVAPDRATLVLGARTLAPTAAQAMNRNAGLMNAVIAALDKAGIAPRDVRTDSLSLAAQYVYAQDKPPVLTGYQATNQVSVTVNDLSRLGPAIDAATAAGANQINEIRFGLKDSAAAEDAARRAAVEALAAKAALYADATGYRIARLVRLTENTGETAEPIRPLALARVTAKPSPTPVSAGELTVRVSVSGIYELTK